MAPAGTAAPASSTSRASKPSTSVPAAPRPGRARPVGDEVVQRLGGAHHLHQLQAEAIGPGLEDRRRQRLAGGHTEAERGQVEAPLDVGHLQHPGVEGRDREEHRGPLGVDHCQRALGRQPLGHQHGGGAGPGREVERVAEAEGEVELGGREDQVVGADAEDVGADQLGGRHEGLVGVDGRLRPPRRAGGVAPVHDVLARSWAPPPPAAWPGPAPRRSRPPRPTARRPPARSAATGSGPGRGEHARRHRGLDDGRPGAAVVEEELVLRLAHQRVHRHGDGAELGRPPEGGGEGRRVVEGQQHALLGLDPEPRPGPRQRAPPGRRSPRR